MNILSVGLDKAPLLKHLPSRFLLIDDGSFIDRINLPRAKVFDVLQHSFDPLRRIDHKKARELADLFYAADPGGENTLTVRDGKRALTKLLLSGQPLDRITGDRTEKPVLEALGVLENALLSPVLRNIFLRATNFYFSSRSSGDYTPSLIIARIDRAELGDFDAFLLGNLLISRYPGPVVVPDFGFYAYRSHVSLIRQGRLIAGVNFFDEVPNLKNELLTIPTKIGRHCTPEDAELLARYEGISPSSLGYREHVERLISPTVPESELDSLTES
jgi:hypothetical protein